MVNQLEVWLDKLERGHSKVIDLGLDRVQVVSSRLKHQFDVPVVMVAGTNGKGSTVAILAKLLRNAGLKVGTYTSPHLLRFNERIQINGSSVSDAILCESFECVKAQQQNISLTFFEFTTLAALTIFQEAPLDIIILEIGLGGRLDAVNIVDPSLAIITSIGLDHQEYLGETLSEIAIQKAGIIRKNIPVILGSQALNKEILATCDQHKNTVYQSERDFGFVGQSQQWQFKNEKKQLPPTYLPEQSVSLACAAYTILGENSFLLPDLCKVSNFLDRATMVGRAYTMTLDNNVTVMLDVAHNPMGSEWLAREITKRMPGKKIIAVWASLVDKDLAQIIYPMKALMHRWYIGFLPKVARATATDILHNTLKEQNVQNVFTLPTIVEAFDEALANAQANDVVVVFGSFFTVSQVLSSLSVAHFEETELNDNGLGIYHHG